MAETTKTFLNAQLERYEIEERIGSGGMARVYKGQDKVLNRTVAIKVLHEHLADDPTFMQRFKQEAQFVASFNHPNIVQVYDFNMIERGEEKIFYMVMSYIPGKNLREILQDPEERLDDDRILQIALDLLNALSYAHARGMIHRDIKPANILFDERGNAILTDFGIARMAQNSQLTQEGLAVGTPAYMSPEQAKGDIVDHRSDLYAMGVILYEMLTGCPPFDDDGSLSVLLKHLNDPVPPLSKHRQMDNPELEAVIAKALGKSTTSRYQQAEDFANDLKRAFNRQTAEFAGYATQQLTDLSTTSKTSITLPTIASVKNAVSRTPYAIFGIGLGIIALLVVISFFNNQQDTQANTITESAIIQEIDDDIQAVQSMTQMPVFFVTDFAGDNPYNIYWPQGNASGVEREITPDGYYRIASTLSGRAIATIFEPGNDYTDHIIRVQGRLEDDSAATSAYGIIFRYVDNDNYNVFAVDGMGRYSIWVRSDGQWIELRDAETEWTSHPEVNAIGEDNILQIEIMGNTLIGSVNGVMVTSVMDDTLLTGGVGVYVASPPTGTINARLNMYGVMESLESITDSMTGPNLDEIDSMTGDP